MANNQRCYQRLKTLRVGSVKALVGPQIKHMVVRMQLEVNGSLLPPVHPGVMLKCRHGRVDVAGLPWAALEEELPQMRCLRRRHLRWLDQPGGVVVYQLWFSDEVVMDGDESEPEEDESDRGTGQFGLPSPGPYLLQHLEGEELLTIVGAACNVCTLGWGWGAAHCDVWHACMH